jgi:hypothetical protein
MEDAIDAVHRLPYLTELAQIASRRLFVRAFRRDGDEVGGSQKLAFFTQGGAEDRSDTPAAPIRRTLENAMLFGLIERAGQGAPHC